MDALIVFAMFILRIGVPIVILLLIGHWLEKRLQLQQPSEEDITRIELARARRSEKVIQLHCWDFKRCDPAQRAQCAAFRRPDLPCWLALQVCGEKVHPECFNCALYRPEAIAA